MSSNENQALRRSEQSPDDAPAVLKDVSSDGELKQHEADQRRCGECGGKVRQDTEQDEFVCQSCGLVCETNFVDRGPDWRSVDEDGESKRRVGSPLTNTMHDRGLSTMISKADRDSYGNRLSGAKRQKWSRLRTWDERFRTRDSKERNLKQALAEIQRMTSALGLPDAVTETASVMYRRCLDMDLLPGRSIEAVASACVYAGARQCRTPRSLADIHPVSRVGKTEINRAYRYIAQELQLKLEPMDPRDFLDRYISELPVTSRVAVREQAEELISEAEAENAHSGKAPTSLAAASIYAAGLITEEDLTQSMVADVAGISVVTVRNRYQELLEVHPDYELADG